MKYSELKRQDLLDLATRRVFLEGQVLKVLKAEQDDTEFAAYLLKCRAKDKESRKKRLEVTKQVQQQNKDLAEAAVVKEALVIKLQDALEEAKKSEAEAQKLRDKAIEDLDVLQKKTQFELISIIVKVALAVILGVAILTTILYLFVLQNKLDSTIIETTWSNLFGILLTNSFSIVGTIMGVKYATKDD